MLEKWIDRLHKSIQAKKMSEKEGLKYRKIGAKMQKNQSNKEINNTKVLLTENAKQNKLK